MAAAAPFRPSFNPVEKILTRHTSARRKDLDEDAAEKKVYREVDARDGCECRCCGGRTVKRPSLLRGHEHNHLKKRSTADKATKHSKENVYVVDSRCHALITAGKIRVIGTNAQGDLAHRWTALATKSEREGLTLRDERVRPASGPALRPRVLVDG